MAGKFKPGNLSGKTALITGAAVRIGRSIAENLAAEGVNIVAHYRNSLDEARSLAEEMKRAKVKYWLIQSDFENPAGYEALINNAIDCAGNIDYLVNNASIFPQNTADGLEWAEFIRNIRINTWIPFYLGRAFKEKGQKGVIINILDSRIRDYDSKHAAYILSKKLLEDFTKIMACEFAPGIRVNGIAPGLILPPSGKDEKYLDQLVDSVPLKRHGNVKNIADTAVFLIKNDFITGETIYVDGGMSMVSRGRD